MKCPFCNVDIAQLALHIKEVHPKKFKELEKYHPKIYKKLTKELNLEQLIQTNDPHLFKIKIKGSVEYYKYKCIKCGNCCRNNYDIEIKREDILLWKEKGRPDILKTIQIGPSSITDAQLGLYNVDDALLDDKDQRLERSIDRHQKTQKIIEEDPTFLKELADFILDAHDYLGEDENSPALPHTFIPNVGYRAIFSPKNFEVVEEGWKRNLRYMCIMDLRNQCENLKNNMCAIHEIKPFDCRAYPNKKEMESEERRFQKFLKVCKGIKIVK